MSVLTSVNGQWPAQVLGTLAALFLVGTAAIFLLFFPETSVALLLKEAMAMGWPGAVVFGGLLIYFQCVKRSDPRRPRWTFKTLIAFLAYALLFLAIANFKINFFENTRLLPVSLALVTVLTFVMALYFNRVAPLMRIGGFMFLVAAALSGYGNWLPQVEGGFAPTPDPKPERPMTTLKEFAAYGEKVIFGPKEGVGNGKGQCALCHGFFQDSLSERAPNLLGIPERAAKRLKDPRYKSGRPQDRNTDQKEACEGCGTATTALEYIAESHVCPSCYVVEGYGKNNDTLSPMPPIHKTPISLTIDELMAVEAWLFYREGRTDISPEDIRAAYEKFLPAPPINGPDVPSPPPLGGGLVVTGDESVEVIFTNAMCVACHTIPGIEGATGTIGPKLVEKSNAPLRLRDPDYRGDATSVKEYIMESIVDPSRHVAKGFPDDVMPKDFGKKLNAAALNKLVSYLAKVEEG